MVFKLVELKFYTFKFGTPDDTNRIRTEFFLTISKYRFYVYNTYDPQSLPPKLTRYFPVAVNATDSTFTLCNVHVVITFFVS